MPMTASEIEDKLTAALPGAQIELVDLAGDNDHWQVSVTSEAFVGLPRVRQHKLVMDAIGEGMGTTLHALSIKTHTPQK